MRHTYFIETYSWHQLLFDDLGKLYEAVASHPHDGIDQSTDVPTLHITMYTLENSLIGAQDVKRIVVDIVQPE